MSKKNILRLNIYLDIIYIIYYKKTVYNLTDN